ncbi:MAG: riboflavin kinase [Clostridia bacterium]|nr:riboflavin kinase [Clostridia bacterium]
MTQPLYRLHGVVVHGRANGRTVGMPTANLRVTEGTALPPFGVYAALAEIDGKEYLGVTNVGLRPTLHDGDAAPTVETLLLDFSGDLYGKAMALTLWLYLRPTREMHSLREVERQVERDAASARAWFAENEKRPAGDGDPA